MYVKAIKIKGDPFLFLTAIIDDDNLFFVHYKVKDVKFICSKYSHYMLWYSYI